MYERVCDCVYIVCFDVLCCFGVLNDINNNGVSRVVAMVRISPNIPPGNVPEII